MLARARNPFSSNWLKLPPILWDIRLYIVSLAFPWCLLIFITNEIRSRKIEDFVFEVSFFSKVNLLSTQHWDKIIDLREDFVVFFNLFWLSIML